MGTKGDIIPMVIADTRARYIENKIIPTLNQIVKYKDIDMLVANASFIEDELWGFVHILKLYSEGKVIDNYNPKA